MGWVQPRVEDTLAAEMISNYTAAVDRTALQNGAIENTICKLLQLCMYATISLLTVLHGKRGVVLIT